VSIQVPGTERTPPDPGRLPSLDLEERRREREDRARSWIAIAFVGGYLALLLLSLIPVVIYVARAPDMSLSDVKDLGGVMAAALSSLAGLLGFVLGYYFKASEQMSQEQ
jgi:hypothetical protein